MTDRLKHTCGGCDKHWSGMSMAHCSLCHHTFGGAASFDRHRAGGECRDPDTMDLTYNDTRACWSEMRAPVYVSPLTPEADGWKFLGYIANDGTDWRGPQQQ